MCSAGCGTNLFVYEEAMARGITREEIDEAMTRFLAKGGQIQRMESPENAPAGGNHLGWDDEITAESLSPSMLKGLGVDYDRDLLA
jgi:hypothetical protein